MSSMTGNEVSRGNGPQLSGTNLVRAGDHNQRVTLHAIRVNGPITRTDLADITGLTAPAIANITKRLLHDGLIMEAGHRRGGRGQPATKLVINPDGCFSVGINMAMPGRSTFFKNRRSRKPPATIAPVFPALTIASTLRSASSCQHRLMELSGFLRSATTGDSSIPTTCVQWNKSMRSCGPPALFRAGST